MRTNYSYLSEDIRRWRLNDKMITYMDVSIEVYEYMGLIGLISGLMMGPFEFVDVFSIQ